MADFNAKINLDADNSKALKKIEQVEKAVNRLDSAVNKVSVKVEGTKQAEQQVNSLYKALERLESKALSKLPQSLQLVIAYLKAANQGMAEFTSRAALAASLVGDVGRVSFAPIVRRLKEVKDLMFEIQQVSVKFLDAPRNFRPRLEGGTPFQKLLDGLDLVKVRIIETERLLKGLANTIKALPGFGFGGGGRGGGAGGGGGGGGGARGALPPGDFSFLGNPNTLRGLRELRSQLVDLLDTAVIGSRQFRRLENAVADVNNQIRDAQLLGQRGGSGIGGGPRGAGQRRNLGQPGSIADLERQAEALDQIVRNSRVGSREFKEYSRQLQRTNRELAEATNKTKGFFERLQNPQSRLGSAVIGGGFPLITGGGFGSILGGVVGGGAGGFAGSIAGSGLGQILDEFVLRQQELAAATQTSTDTIAALEAANIRVSSGVKNLIKTLEAAGESAAAFRIQQRELQKSYGKNAQNDLRAYDEANQRLADVFSRLSSQVMPTLIRGATAATNALAALGNFLGDFFVPFELPETGNFRFPGEFAQAGAQEREAVARAGGRTPEQRQIDLQAERFANSSFKQQLDRQREQQRLVEQINAAQIRGAEERARKVKEIRRYEQDILQLTIDREAIQSRILNKRVQINREQRQQNLAKQAAEDFAERTEIETAINVLQTKLQTRQASTKILTDEETNRLDKANLALKKLNRELNAIKAAELGAILGKDSTRSTESIVADVNAFRDALDAASDVDVDEIFRTFQTRGDTFKESIESLQLETQILDAINDKEKLRLERLQEQNRARKEAENLGFDVGQIDQYVAAALARFDAANKEMTDLEKLMESAARRTGQAIEDSIVTALEVAITNAENLGEALQEIASSLLRDIGSMLIRSGLQGLGGNDGVGFFSTLFPRASGGAATTTRPYMVGENGPELFVPQTSGRVINNTDSQMALDRYTYQDNSPAKPPQPIKIEYTSNSIAGQDYVTVDQFQQGMAAAAKQGAKSGETRVMASLRNSRSRRKSLGI